MEVTSELKKYWQTNIKYVSILLVIWFVVSYVCGILFANQLDSIKLGGFPLGFWFANQGSEVIFVILIAIYVKLMNTLDKKYGVDEQ